MPIQSGTHLGPYEILSAIGVGGMGEVYRARDSKLGRDVAIKVLPEAFARDAERTARFQREAKVLASLDHPNIATIHGLEESGGTRALVMQLVEGPTLADRIQAGPIPVDEAIRIARQIADALEYAHERGIVHRDLKPGNVKVTNDDIVKVLDFGLAKALEGDAASVDISTSPTISRMATQAGILLGTAAYMSPEQAKAKPVDRRADIWAFGCVLYEMLTGTQTFTGETVTDTLAAVIMKDPDWSLLPAATPVRVRVLLQRCLQKDPKERLRDIGDARISLGEVIAGAPDPALAGAARISAAPWRRVLPWALFVASLSTAVALAFVHFRERPVAPSQLLRYQISLPEKTSLAGNTPVALSPDGRHLAFTATSQDGRSRLWVRDLDTLESRPLAGTEDAAYPFWSPDSRVLGFATVSKLERVDISGGAPPQTICDVTVGGFGGAWNQDGVILFGSLRGLMRVSAAGGTPSLLTKVDSSRGELAHVGPSFLPDGRHFLYLRYLGSAAGTYVGSLDAKPEQQDSKRLLAAYGFYAPTPAPEPGRVLFLQNGTLMAQTLDASQLELKGDPAPIAEQLTSFDVSANGILAYIEGNASLMQLTWFDRQGKVLGTLGEPGVNAAWPAISPDGSAVVVPRDEAGGTDLWLYNLARGTRSRLTFDGKLNIEPVWSPDGSHIAFLSARDGGDWNIYQKPVNGIGQDEALDKNPPNIKGPRDWSRDGKYLIEGAEPDRFSIWVLPLSPGQAGGDRKRLPYLHDQFNEVGPRLSPNGQWLAYASDETGRFEIYVQTFPKLGGKWPVSINGGMVPVWSRDGKELYFIGADGKLMAVDVKGGPGGSFEAGTPKALFDPHFGGAETDRFDVSKDGRFLVPAVVEQSGAPITIVVNWAAGLNK
jgi:eukaryotic-like serine/threonine-protein kinase